MTEVLSGDLAEVPAPVNMRQVLPAEQMRELLAAIEHVLREASAGREAVFVAHFLAPTIAERQHDLADARLQVQQAGAALAESMAASVRVADQAVRLGELAHARAVVAHRLRTELWSALPDAERHRTLTEQRCPVGAHTGWFAPSDGRQHRCPWCQILELGGYVGHVEHVLATPPVECAGDGVEPMLCDGCGSVDKPVEATDDGRALVCSECQAAVRAVESELCAVHGPHPHAGLSCPDCSTCQLCPEHGTHPCANCERCVVDGAS